MSADPRAAKWSKAIKFKQNTPEFAAFGPMYDNIELMNRIEGFDVVIVCTSTKQQVRIADTVISSHSSCCGIYFSFYVGELLAAAFDFDSRLNFS